MVICKKAEPQRLAPQNATNPSYCISACRDSKRRLQPFHASAMTNSGSKVSSQHRRIHWLYPFFLHHQSDALVRFNPLRCSLKASSNNTFVHFQTMLYSFTLLLSELGLAAAAAPIETATPKTEAARARLWNSNSNVVVTGAYNNQIFSTRGPCATLLCFALIIKHSPPLLHVYLAAVYSLKGIEVGLTSSLFALAFTFTTRQKNTLQSACKSHVLVLCFSQLVHLILSLIQSLSYTTIAKHT